MNDISKDVGPSLCVICRLRPVKPDYQPFCSKRCADIDLHRWLTGAYAIPVADMDEDIRIATKESDASSDTS